MCMGNDRVPKQYQSICKLHSGADLFNPSIISKLFESFSRHNGMKSRDRVQ